MEEHSKLWYFTTVKSTLIIIGIASLVILLLAGVALYDTRAYPRFGENRAELIVRKIGHTLLLHAGDSSSRVLPVRKKGESIFELAFQSPFAFMPDTLVHIVRTQLAAYDLPADYTVQVFECATQAVVYGFAVGQDQPDILSCQGRVQPLGCYTVQIAFSDADGELPARPYLLLTLALASLATIAFVGRTWIRQSTDTQKKGNTQEIAIGRCVFYPKQGVLENGEETVLLSGKETQLLRIFATQPNQLIERDRLLKEVWEDEGVFTGRSLDVFISRLRKKLQSDTSVRLTNIHSKGYVLEIES